MKSIRVGNGAGFWGDNLDAPRRLAEAGHLDYLTLEYLAELTLSILAHLKSRDPQAGYVTDFPMVLSSLIPALQQNPNLRIVTNAGGMNPTSCARRAAELLHAAGLGDIAIAAVSGDDLLPDLDAHLAAGETLAHLDQGTALSEIRPQLASANAYLGAAGIVEALSAGARIVITGRVADASLTVGPAVYEFGWKWTDWDLLAVASVAGHLIECGAQVTGGMFSGNAEGLSLEHLGYPIAELSADGSVVITKPAETGGRVSVATVSEQLVYEIGDPQHYLTPDLDADFSGVSLEALGEDRVAVHGARGDGRPDKLKVSMAYRDGYMAVGTLVLYGSQAEQNARTAAKLIFSRLETAGVSLARTNVELLGTGIAVPGVLPAAGDCQEVVLRISAHDPSRAALERFLREFSPLVGSGPPGVTGYTGPRSKPYPVFAYWPTLISRDRVPHVVEVRPAVAWLS